jgi:hypothetical protein
MSPHGSYPAQQLPLWRRFPLPHRKKKPKQAPSRPAPALAPATPLTEKTLPGVGGVVCVIGRDKRWQIAGVMLCGPDCYVLLRAEGVTEGKMKVELAETLTLP